MYQINPKILQTQIADGKLLLLEPQKGLYFELNEVSVVIYQCIIDGMNHVDTLERIVDTFDIDTQVAQSDMLELIQHFCDNNIIKPKSNS